MSCLLTLDHMSVAKYMSRGLSGSTYLSHPLFGCASMGITCVPYHGSPDLLELMSPSILAGSGSAHRYLMALTCYISICWPAALVDLPPPLATLPCLPPRTFWCSQIGGARYSPPSSGPHTGITPHDAPSGDPSVGARPLLANLCRYYRNDPLMWKWGSCWRLLRAVEDRSRLPEGISYM